VIASPAMHLRMVSVLQNNYVDHATKLQGGQMSAALIIPKQHLHSSANIAKQHVQNVMLDL